MDSDYTNKILMAVLSTCLALVALNIAAGAVFSPEHPAKPGFEIAVQEKSEGEAGGQHRHQDLVGEVRFHRRAAPGVVVWRRRARAGPMAAHK